MQIRGKTLVWSAAGLLAVGTATGLSAATLLQSTTQTAPAAAVTDSVAAGAAASHAISPATAPNYRAIVERNQAAVVGITSAGAMDTSAQEFNFGGPFGDNDNPLSQFFRGVPRPRGHGVMHVQGSGFLVSSDGIVLTNAHVVDGAKEVTVKLSNHREYKAKVLGADRSSDIAVLKIDAHSLPTVQLGDSDRLHVGDYVLAIGEPFGLEETATAGIVSAKGRSLPGDGYVPFIQTDAAVNPGNSGGPLFDANGNVVGINAQIYSNSGGYQGVSFAIPINLVKEVLPQLRGKGKVTRGYLGVLIQKVTPEIAESLGMEKGYGALVANVSKEGPADKAGVKVGDVITEFDGKEVKDSGDLPIIVARTTVDKKVRMKVLRDKKEIVLSVAVGELKDEEVVAAVPEKGELGLTVQRLTPQIAESLGLEKAEGVVVTAVEPSSAADEAGIRRADIILEVDRKAVRNVDEYKKAVAGVRKGRGVLFLVRRGDSTLFLALKPPR